MSQERRHVRVQGLKIRVLRRLKFITNHLHAREGWNDVSMKVKNVGGKSNWVCERFARMKIDNFELWELVECSGCHVSLHGSVEKIKSSNICWDSRESTMTSHEKISNSIAIFYSENSYSSTGSMFLASKHEKIRAEVESLVPGENKELIFDFSMLVWLLTKGDDSTRTSMWSLSGGLF